MKEIDPVDFVTNEMTMYKIGPHGSLIIKTKEIADLEKQILKSVSIGVCGESVISRSRCGKTKAMRHIKDSLHKIYGDEFPVVEWTWTEHAITEKNFYQKLAGTMELPFKASTTAGVLKDKVVSAFVTLALETPFKKAVLLIDEAMYLQENDFMWLMDLYNVLGMHGILLVCVFFSTHEFLRMRDVFVEEGREQIINRFMLNIRDFYGIREQAEITLCLHSLDAATVESQNGDDRTLREFYFPKADKDERRFRELDGVYWEAFQRIRIDNDMTAPDIPMAFFMGSFSLLLANYGRLSDNPVTWPGYEEIYKCILETGYAKTGEEYENLKTSTKNTGRRKK